MKIRNLEAQYDNLHPTHVVQIAADLQVVDLTTYQRLWDYARNLEKDVKYKNSVINKMKHEIRKVHNAIYRKHRRVMIIKAFGKSFADFKFLTKAFE